MKANETTRGDTVIYNGIEAIVIEPMINTVKISMVTEAGITQTTTTYDKISKLAEN